jgi:hypothetical protein
MANIEEWTREKLVGLSPGDRFKLLLRANEIKSPAAQHVIDTIEELGLPAYDATALRHSDPIALKIYEIVTSKEGRAACIAANSNGVPALAGVEPMLVETLESDYSGSNRATVVAGIFVGDVMRSAGYKKSGERAMPLGSIAKTAALWVRR